MADSDKRRNNTIFIFPPCRGQMSFPCWPRLFSWVANYPPQICSKSHRSLSCHVWLLVGAIPPGCRRPLDKSILVLVVVVGGGGGCRGGKSFEQKKVGEEKVGRRTKYAEVEDRVRRRVHQIEDLVEVDMEAKLIFGWLSWRNWTQWQWGAFHCLVVFWALMKTVDKRAGFVGKCVKDFYTLAKSQAKVI